MSYNKADRKPEPDLPGVVWSVECNGTGRLNPASLETIIDHWSQKQSLDQMFPQCLQQRRVMHVKVFTVTNNKIFITHVRRT